MDIVEEFKKVRDIPYRTPLFLEEPDECCSGKAAMLFNRFKAGGYEARYRLCTFCWSDLELPEKVRIVPHDEESSHTYLEINLDGKWIIVDATWDKKLGGLFHINEWDGKADTKIAVPAKEILPPEKSLDYIKYISTAEAVAADLELNGEFYRAFNAWLKTIRKK